MLRDSAGRIVPNIFPCFQEENHEEAISSAMSTVNLGHSSNEDHESEPEELAEFAAPPEKMSKSELKKWKKKQRAAAAKARKQKEAAEFEAQLTTADGEGAVSDGETVAKAEAGDDAVLETEAAAESETPVDQLVTDSGEVAADSDTNGDALAATQVSCSFYLSFFFHLCRVRRMPAQMQKMRLLQIKQSSIGCRRSTAR